MLFNTAVFGTRLFNGGTTIATVYITDAVAFGNFSLSDNTYMILTEYPTITTGPTREIESGPVPRGHGMYQTNEFFRLTTIELRGYVKHTSAALLAAYLDTIKKNLRVSQGDLDIIDDAGVVKRYTATVDNFEDIFADRQRYHINICPFKIRFKCLTPFGKARTYTSTSLSITSSPTTQTVTNEGTYKALPIISLNFDAATSITAVSVSNTTTGESITYTGSIAAGNLLVFDSEAKQVTKAGTAVDFTGSFVNLDVNSNSIVITVTGTSFSAIATYSHKLTYL